MDGPSLRQFLAVAETGNVSLAAEAMNVSQPTVSVNLRKLEEAHGVALFRRSSRGVVLTDYGRILYEHARVMARLDAHAAAEIQARKLLDRPSLKIGCGHAWWPLFVRQTVRRVSPREPRYGVCMSKSAAASTAFDTSCRAMCIASSARASVRSAKGLRFRSSALRGRGFIFREVGASARGQDRVAAGPCRLPEA
jgi:DNA-binding transcriptional LysR family regulator